MSDILKSYFSEEQAAKGVGLTPRTLRNYRAQGIGPPWTRIGRDIYYEKSSLAAWLKSLEVRPVRSREMA
jgi:DNA-binding transcriptional MerR regulator